MTVERVRIPWDLVGQYGQLFRLAQQGLILMNTSIVEPGYDGPLSCVVVNLSKDNITIAPESEIAKLTFERLSAVPGVKKPQHLTDKRYISTLAAAAVKLPKSFMGIEQVSQEVSDKVNADVKKSITFGGVILIFLLLLATLQPWISGLIFNRYPISTSDAAQIKSELVALAQKTGENVQIGRTAILLRRAVLKVTRTTRGRRGRRTTES